MSRIVAFSTIDPETSTYPNSYILDKYCKCSSCNNSTSSSFCDLTGPDFKNTIKYCCMRMVSFVVSSTYSNVSNPLAVSSDRSCLMDFLETLFTSNESIDTSLTSKLSKLSSELLFSESFLHEKRQVIIRTDKINLFIFLVWLMPGFKWLFT